MLILVAIALAIATVPLAGGDVRRLHGRRFRLPWLPIAALAAQFVVLSSDGLAEGLAAALHVATYVPLAVFLVANRRIAGLPVLVLGLLLNSAVIIANDGVMPADADAMRRAGLHDREGFDNSAPVEDPALRWLGDIHAVPEPVPFANVFSLGDVVLVAGVLVYGHTEGGSRLSPGGRARARRSLADPAR